jgi:hypothetical protein
MIEKCSIGNMNNNLQNITLIILILILIIVILFYIRNSSLKHDELVEKYTTISTNVINRTPDISHNGPFPDTNRLSFFSTSGTAVTLRPCQVKFNDDGSSKYEYQDDWQEIGMLDGGEVPVKVIGRDNTTNASDITNFSEKSRCFKELSSTDTYKYKYLNNDLIQYDKNNYVSLTSNINGVPVAKNYMEMKFDVFGSNINHFDNIRNSICSLNYSKTLRSDDSSSSSTLGNTELYRLKLTNGNIIENIEKITIDPTDNHVFNKNTSFEVANLIGANTGIYKYDTASKLFVFEPRNASVSNDIRTINLYQFERNLFCDKQEIKSYKKLNNAKIDMIKIINYDMPPPTFFPDTKIPDRYLTSTYISNIRKENSLTEVKGYLNDLIKNELNILNTATSNILQDKRDANTILINQRTAFIEPSNNSKGKFIQNAIIKNNYDDDKNKYKLLLSKDYYDLGFGDVTYSSYTINEGHSSIVVNSGDEPILKEFVSETGSGTQDVWEVKVFKENDTFNFPVNTTCDILIVGGGGAGGYSYVGGGGGAGGYVYVQNITLNGNYTINVGKGGAITTSTSGNNGENSSIIGPNVSYIALGGGGGAGGSVNGTVSGTGNNGGSGGGGSYRQLSQVPASGGTSTQFSTYSYGNGGNGGSYGSPWFYGGGGGGAGGSVSGASGTGANGLPNTITGVSVTYAGGGGAGTDGVTTFQGGSGGGGRGATGDGIVAAIAGTDGLGGGGGGARGNGSGSAAKGGSGIVIIRYRSLATAPTSVNMIKTLNFNYYSSLSPTIYTLTFNTRTLATINNGSDKLLNGSYTITLGNTLSTIVPTTANQNLQDTKYSSSTISVSYHLLNPIIDTIGAQWTYSSSNTNVYHLGSVGIGTTNPEYSLDVRGFVHTSVGGYTQTGSENWIIQSDRRIKENIVKASYDKCLENIKKIELYNFNFKENYVNTNDRNQLGFIAQEVQEIYPKAVIVRPDEEKGDLLTVNTTQIKYTLYGAVKSLIDKVENLEMRVDKLYKIAIPDVDIIEIFESTSNISIITSNISRITSN